MKRIAVERQSLSEDEDERILPLINIVFLLLIFFMITGSLSRIEPFEIEPPVSDAPEVEENRRPVIHMAADGRLAVGEQDSSMAELERTLRAVHGGVPARVWVKADGGSDASALVALMEALGDAGVQGVRLLSVQREP